MKTNKTVKEIGLLIATMLIVFTLVACGGVKEPVDVDIDEDIPADDFRVVAIIKDVLNVKLHPLHLSFTTEFENDLMEVELFVKDDNIRMDSQDPEYGLVSLITNETGDYIVMQDYKVYYLSTDPLEKEEMTFLLTEEEIADFIVTIGQEEIKGIMYDYERLTGEDDVFTFYFNLGTNEWAALKTKDTMMYIKEISGEVDESIFLIPSDFQEATV